MLKKSTIHNNGQSILSINGHDVNYVFFYCQNLEKGLYFYVYLGTLNISEKIREKLDVIWMMFNIYVHDY